MKNLSTVSRVITPLAMVVFLAHEINQSMQVVGWWAYALLIGSVGTAIGIEIVGILAGHALEGFWRIGDTWRGLLSFVLLLVYTVTAVYILRHNQAMVLVPVIAAIVYLLSSLTEGLETAVIHQENEVSQTKAWDREQAAADREIERRLKIANAKLKHEERMAKLASKPQVAQPPQVDKHPTQVGELTPAQLRVYNAIKMQPDATYTAIGEQLGISRQAVSGHAKAINGLAK